MDEFVQKQVNAYLKRAHRALKTGHLVLDDEDYAFTVSRAYFATFYAVNALLATKGVEIRKHSGFVNAFRQHFVKSGLIEVEYGDLYGKIMRDRYDGDYSLDDLSYETATRDLDWAERFVRRVEKLLKEIGAST
jgi:uncharacterized protein (UPF0332 family)